MALKIPNNTVIVVTDRHEPTILGVILYEDWMDNNLIPKIVSDCYGSKVNWTLEPIQKVYPHTETRYYAKTEEE